MEKVYVVKFMQYTNCIEDTVSNNSKGIQEREYIHVGYEPFLIKESDIDKYMKYGGGFRSIKFVGNMEI